MTNTKILPDVDPSLEDEITPICCYAENSGWIRKKSKQCQEKATWIIYFTCPTAGRMLGGCPAGSEKFGYACNKHLEASMNQDNIRTICSGCKEIIIIQSVKPI